MAAGFVALAAAVELRSTGQPRAAAPTWAVAVLD